MVETASLAMEDLDPDRLLRDWTLTDADRAEVARARGPENRLWTALHLCNLRHTGRFLDDPGQLPPGVLIHLAGQTGEAPPTELRPLARPATDSAIRARVRDHLGFVPFSAEAQTRLEVDLAEVAADGPSLAELIQRAEALLCAARIVLPARSTLGQKAHLRGSAR